MVATNRGKRAHRENGLCSFQCNPFFRLLKFLVFKHESDLDGIVIGIGSGFVRCSSAVL